MKKADEKKGKSRYTITQFRKEYQTEEACLDKIFQIKYGKLSACPNCGVVDAQFKRIMTRRCYQCSECKYQLYPTAGTVFEKTRTPLTLWFYAIYLFTATRNGVSAKELERQLGVTYKTAWRMGIQIRKLMFTPLSAQLTGEVLVDETFIGGLERNKHKNKRKDKKVVGYVGKTPVIGLMEKGGKIITKVIEESQVNGENI